MFLFTHIWELQPFLGLGMVYFLKMHIRFCTFLLFIFDFETIVKRANSSVSKQNIFNYHCTKCSILYLGRKAPKLKDLFKAFTHVVFFPMWLVRSY